MDAGLRQRRPQRDGAQVAELTGLLDLTGWPTGTRILARREVAHPGAQLRLTDHDRRRITCFATNTRRGQLAEPELRHRRRARVEDRIRAAKDTGLGKLPCRHAAANRVWIAIVLLACELLAWTQTLALTGPLPAAEPKTLRLRLLAVAGRLVRTGRRTHPRLDRDWPSAATVAHAVDTLHAIPDSA